MTLEVELKFRVDDPEAFRRRLETFAPRPLGTETQSDHYWNHPSRDFAQTDEAFRIRALADHLVLTYKGPRLDQATKTRFESEIPLATQDEAAVAEMLEALGFRPVATVRKRRESFAIAWQGQSITLALDTVDGLGTFVELERVVPESQVAQAQQSVLGFAAQLGCDQPIHTSYLELVLTQAG